MKIRVPCWSGMVLIVVVSGACRQGSPTPSVDNAAPPPAAAQSGPVEPEPKAAQPAQPPPKLTIPIVNPPPVSWITVEKEREGSPGGYATGSFSKPQNKVTIETKDVQRFVLDTAQIELDWSRPVVLNIDKRNYELRRRNNPAIRFDRNPYGEWIVVDP